MAYLAAAALAVVTLFVFYTLQNYGPESAVRKFNALLQTAAQDPEHIIDRNQLASLVLPPQDQHNLPFLIRQFAPYFADGARFTIVKQADGDSYPRGSWTEHTVHVVVAYQLPASQLDYAVWVAARDSSGYWKIDADLTATLRRDVN
jgi:hypothetical protein